MAQRYQYIPPYDYSSYIASSRANTLPPLQTDAYPPPSPPRQRQRAASIPPSAPWTSPYDVSPIMSRSPSVAGSDRFSAVSGITGYWPQNPLHVHPAAAYVAQLGAAQVVSEYRGTHKETVSSDDDDSNANRDDVQFGEPALELINSFLDNLLYSILASARSTSLSALRPAVTDVLKSRLAKEAISSADEELQELLAGGEEEDDKAQPTPKENSRKWDLELVWKRTRLRVMVYMRLGEMEDDDEEKYVKEQELFSGRELDSRRFSANSGLVSWSAAIFLTSVLEYVAEQTLQISGSAAYARARRQSRTALKALQPQDRVLVEEYDVERVALDSRVGRLWRTWRKTLRSNNSTRPETPTQRGTMRSRRNSYREGIAAALARQDEHMSSGEDNGVPALPRGFLPVDVPEMEHPEHVIASNIPLPMGDARRDVDEIEVPGLARDPDLSSEEEGPPVEGKTLRRNSFTHPALVGTPNGLPTPADSTSPASPIPTKLPFFKPLLQRHRSNSVPTPLRTPMLEIPGAFPTFADEDEEKVAPVAAGDNTTRALEQVPEVDDNLGQEHKAGDVKVLLDKVVGGAPLQPETEEQKAKGQNHGLIAAGVAGATALAGAATAAVLGQREGKSGDAAQQPEAADIERPLPPARVRSDQEIEELDKRKSMMDIKAIMAEQDGVGSRSGSLAPPVAADAQTDVHANGTATAGEPERELSSASTNRSFTLGHATGVATEASAMGTAASEAEPAQAPTAQEPALDKAASAPQENPAFAKFAGGASRLRGITALNTEDPSPQPQTPPKASRRDAPLYMPAPSALINKNIEPTANTSSPVSRSGTSTPQRQLPGSGTATPTSAVDKPRDERDFLPSRSRRNSLERRATLDADKMRGFVLPTSPNGEAREGWGTRSRRASLERRMTLDEGKMRGFGMSSTENTRSMAPAQETSSSVIPPVAPVASNLALPSEVGAGDQAEPSMPTPAAAEITAPRNTLPTSQPPGEKIEQSEAAAPQLLSTPVKSGAAGALSGAVTPPVVTGASMRGPEDFDALVQSADTAKYTLTPETVRDGPIEAVSQPPAELRPVESKRVSMIGAENGTTPKAVESTAQAAEPLAGPAEALRRLEQPQEDDKRASRSQTSKQATSAQIPTDKTVDKELTTDERAARRRSTSKPPPRNTSEHRRSGLIAREPQVVTESIRDFADFIRSTGPDKEPTLYQLSTNNRSTTSLHSLRSTVGSTRERSQSIGAMSLASEKDVGRTKSLTQKDMVSRNIPPVPPMPGRPGGREARGATGAGSSNNDLINFLRDGPEGGKGERRISRSVAPFRNTMDSDLVRDDFQAEDFKTGHAGYPTLNTSVSGVNGPKSAGSSKGATAVSYGSAAAPLPQPVSKVNGGGAYVPPAKQQPAHSGQPSRLSAGNMLAAPGKPAGGDFEKKRYRNKDPYAIDMDSDDDGEDLLTALPPNRGRQEESLADFLRNTEPPADNAPKAIVGSAAAGRAASMTSGSASTAAQPLLDTERTRSLQTPYSASVTSSASNLHSKTRGPKLEAREPATRVAKSATSELAEFFRNEAPPAGSAPGPVVGRSGGRGSAGLGGRGGGEKDAKKKGGMWVGVVAFARGFGRKGSGDGSAREGEGVRWGGRRRGEVQQQLM